MASKSRVALLAALALALPATAFGDPAPSAQTLENQGVTELIVKRDEGLPASERSDIRADAGGHRVKGTRPPTPRSCARPDGRLVEALDELNADPRVVWAERSAGVRLRCRSAPVIAVVARRADACHGRDRRAGRVAREHRSGGDRGTAGTAFNLSSPELAPQLSTSPAGWDFVVASATPRTIRTGMAATSPGSSPR